MAADASHRAQWTGLTCRLLERINLLPIIICSSRKEGCWLANGE